MAYFGPERPLSFDETAQWIENHENLRAAEGFAPWVVCLRTSGNVIGWGGLTRDSRDKTPRNELIYILAPAHWGLGLGTELAEAAVTYGFQTLGLGDIESSVRPQNTRSIRILKRLRMTLVRHDDTGRQWYRLTHTEYQNHAEQGAAAAADRSRR